MRQTIAIAVPCWRPVYPTWWRPYSAWLGEYAPGYPYAISSWFPIASRRWICPKSISPKDMLYLKCVTSSLLCAWQWYIWWHPWNPGPVPFIHLHRIMLAVHLALGQEPVVIRNPDHKTGTSCGPARLVISREGKNIFHMYNEYVRKAALRFLGLNELHIF